MRARCRPQRRQTPKLRPKEFPIPNPVHPTPEDEAAARQLAARIKNEEYPRWWNGLTDDQRRMYIRSASAAKEDSFLAGVVAALAFRAAHPAEQQAGAIPEGMLKADTGKLAELIQEMEEIRADLSKKFKAIPLTDDQVKAVNEYLAERRRNMQRPGGGN